MNQILARTDGVPLFVEELTKTVLETGLLQERDGHYVLNRPLPSMAIPTTLHASLMARLDRLAPVREVAQIGAVVGREFSYELLNAVAGLPKQKLEEALGQLVRSELVFCRGEIPQAVYTFKHVLVRDAAYSGLLKSRRARCMPPSRTRSSNSSQKSWRLNPKLSRTISRRPDCSKRQWDIGFRPARRPPCAPPTWKLSRTCRGHRGVGPFARRRPKGQAGA